MLAPFRPHPLVRGGHLQTIIGYYLSNPKTISQTKLHLVPLPDADKLVLCENRPSRKAGYPAVIVFMHGLGGHAESPYMLRLAEMFRHRGWIAFRMNHRGCGKGVGLARHLYHSGRSDDLSRTLMHVSKIYPGIPLIAAGFSLSGNALLKLLGEGRDPIPANLCGAIAVTPPIDLSKCAVALCKTSNYVYDLRFVRMLKDTIRERQMHFSDFPKIKFPLRMTLRDFDEMCTAPRNGFTSAEDYYTKCSAKQFLMGISVPTYLLASADDPFIPRTSFDDLPENQNLTVHITSSGGHMGFVASEKTPLGSYNWMDYAILRCAEEFVKEYVGVPELISGR
ncbi:MAG TPA: alpha/beta hydrolase [bacterium]